MLFQENGYRPNQWWTIRIRLMKPRCVKNEYFLPKQIDPPSCASTFLVFFYSLDPHFHSLSGKWIGKQFEHRLPVSGEPSRRSRCPSTIFSRSPFSFARQRLSQFHPETFVISDKTEITELHLDFCTLTIETPSRPKEAVISAEDWLSAISDLPHLGQSR